MYLTSMIAVLLTSACLPADTPDHPPPLTFDKHVDYIAWYNDFVSKGKTENAYELYKGLDPDEDHKGGIPKLEGVVEEQFNKTKERVWSPDDHPELAAYLRECAPYLDIFRRASKRRDYWLPALPDTELLLVDVMMPNLSNNRAASRVILKRSWMKQNDQSKVMIDACHLVLRNADHMQQSSGLVHSLTGLAEQCLVYQTIRAALTENVIAGENISITYKTILPYGSDSANLSRVIVAEWGATLDAVQYVYERASEQVRVRYPDFTPPHKLNDSQQKVVRILLRTFLSNRIDKVNDIGGFDILDPQGTARLINMYFKGNMEMLPGPLSLKTATKLARFDASERFVSTRKGILAIGLAKYYLLSLRGETARRGTLLTLALHSYHAKYDKWPKSLEEVDRKLRLQNFKNIRKDPHTGEDFIYKLRDGKPLLYSVAFDGKDDTGHHDRKWGESEGGGDYVFWPYQQD